ncbi:hypothetical protein SAMN02910298_01265 [Pseudobutyrivibrio sp. YE44]|uniref:hypothetical protein n=1 Tax=Pseudobutyrivibrio sp. YE44 TaxID=1520802 RepID=UPI00088E16CB|nr:hypothetical protein [Pseudobutyrivibrio sp. YE44]SDB25228.1 hypothetical protein SAMN02910298_01265 [Pseudobutyrivibrio sp. YE44]
MKYYKASKESNAEGIREKTEINTKTQSIIDLMDTTGQGLEEVMKLLKIDPKDYDLYKKNVNNMLLVK